MGETIKPVKYRLEVCFLTKYYPDVDIILDVRLGKPHEKSMRFGTCTRRYDHIEIDHAVSAWKRVQCLPFITELRIERIL